ncbi:uncharacterized protein LOC118148822 [Callithrix jacchus]
MGAPRPACTKPRPRVPACDVCFELSPCARLKSRRQNYRKIPAGERRDKSAWAPAEPRLAAPGEGKHAPTHSPLRAPKITRAGRAPTPGQPAPTSGAPGTHPESSALPPTGRMVPPRSPPDPLRVVRLLLEVAAVAAVVTEAGSPARRDLIVQRMGAPSPAYPSPPPSCCNCQLSAWNPEGQLPSRPRGPEQGSRGSGSRPLGLTSAPAPRAELVSLPPSSGKGQADAPLLTSPAGFHLQRCSQLLLWASRSHLRQSD